MMIVCPVCGAQIALAGDEDTAASEIVMRRREGEVVVRIWFTAGPFTDELLHTCDPAEYPAGSIPWSRDRNFPVRHHVALLTGDSVPMITARIETYAMAIGNVAHDVHFAPLMGGFHEPRAISAEAFRAVDRLLAQAFDAIEPP